MPLQPHQLRRLHFRRHDAAEIAQHFVAGRRAFIRFIQRAVIEPDDCVPAFLAGRRDGQRTALFISNDEGTGGIKTNANDMRGIDLGRSNGALYGDTDGFPYVFRIMLRMTGKRLVHQDWMFDAAKQFSTGIENARTRATCPDIDSTDKLRASCDNIGAVLFLGWRDNPRGRWRGRCVYIGRRRLTKWLAASRKPEGPGEFGPNPSGFGVVRCTHIGLAKPLDLVHKFPPAERVNIVARGSKHQRTFGVACVSKPGNSNMSLNIRSG